MRYEVSDFLIPKVNLIKSSLKTALFIGKSEVKKTPNSQRRLPPTLVMPSVRDSRKAEPPRLCGAVEVKKSINTSDFAIIRRKPENP